MAMFKLYASTAASIALAVATVPLAARAAETSMIEQLLTVAEGLFTDENYEAFGDHDIDSLQEDQSETIAVSLDADVDYVFVGVCDSDCTDLDIRIVDQRGAVVESDLEDDDSPIVQFTPSRSGRYSIKVSMVACSQEPCAFGLTTMVRNAAIKARPGKPGAGARRRPTPPAPERKPTPPVVETPRGMAM